ncbi:DNA mismatch repair protein MutS [Dichotomocladium elegans]|nr:DNA mismatch repair protein MutS [Dichotomocladium elegans]
MFRLCNARRVAAAARPVVRRTLSSSSVYRKRVTIGTFSEVFKAAPTKSPLPTAQSPTRTPKKRPLEPRLPYSGSVVLDAVREFTLKYPSCVVLVQVGDFYELYESHASQYGPPLDLKVTKKEMASGVTVDFAGFPSRVLDRYLDMLVNQLGCRVALCEQYTKEGDSTIRRHITRVLTPGTVIEERFLDAHSNNYLLAVMPPQDLDHPLGLAWIDVSVGEFNMQPSQFDLFKDDLARIRPREVVIPESFATKTKHPLMQVLAADPNISVSHQPDDLFNSHTGKDRLAEMFPILPDSDRHQHQRADDAFSDPELAASMALLSYIDSTHPENKPKLLRPTRMNIHDTLQIDSAAMGSLELVRTIRDGKRTNSLLATIDYTQTHAGSRLLARWLSAPLTSLAAIEKRQNVVEFFVNEAHVLDAVRYAMQQSADAQRALQRLALRRGQHMDLIEIWSTLNAIKSVKTQLQLQITPPQEIETRKRGRKAKQPQEQPPAAQLHEQGGETTLDSQKAALNEAVKDMIDMLDPHEQLIDKIEKAFDCEKIISGDIKGADYGYVRPEFNKELYKLHQTLDSLSEERKELETKLKAIGGNSVSLLVNAVYSHIVEINARQASKLLAHYPHAVLINQTKSKHRYELSEWTALSMNLQNTHARITELESQVWDKVVGQVLEQTLPIISSSIAFAQLDVLCSFAWMAKRFHYVRPEMTADSDRTLYIEGGRHPVVEANLAAKGRPFVRNDCHLRDGANSWLLTGPNMGGKSTFLRQNAIILLLAHTGSFVPAQRAKMAVVDRVFSRVGASDNLAEDQSTFMVEMSETATILRHATCKSFVIMDEVGRGTSTSDGLSLAFAILAYLHQHIGCQTLFATHYHELADCMSTQGTFDAVKYYKTDLQEDSEGRFSFIHRVQPGVCRRSHGIKVAQLAGLPGEVLDMARDNAVSITHKQDGDLA